MTSKLNVNNACIVKMSLLLSRYLRQAKVSKKHLQPFLAKKVFQKDLPKKFWKCGPWFRTTWPYACGFKFIKKTARPPAGNILV